MLREALQNLVTNAFRHGGPKLSNVQVTCARAENEVKIQVIDDGIGISLGHIEATKTRFAQIAATSGSGLGVSIVQAIAEGHGGLLVLSPTEQGLKAELKLKAD